LKGITLKGITLVGTRIHGMRPVVLHLMGLAPALQSDGRPLHQLRPCQPTERDTQGRRSHKLRRTGISRKLPSSL